MEKNGCLFCWQSEEKRATRQKGLESDRKKMKMSDDDNEAKVGLVVAVARWQKLDFWGLTTDF